MIIGTILRAKARSCHYKFLITISAFWHLICFHLCVIRDWCVIRNSYKRKIIFTVEKISNFWFAKNIISARSFQVLLEIVSGLVFWFFTSIYGIFLLIRVLLRYWFEVFELPDSIIVFHDYCRLPYLCKNMTCLPSWLFFLIPILSKK